MMVWLFPESVFRFYIGYTLTGAFYGLVLHYTLPDFLYKPNLSTLIFTFAFGLFAGSCSFSWFRDSAGIAAPHYSALALGVAGLISGSLAFGKTIAAHAENKSKLTIEKTALSVAGILIAARWLGSVIGEVIANTILDPIGINWENSPYLLVNIYYVLFAAFSVWFLIRAMKNLLAISMTKRNATIMIISWIAGMVATSFTCVYLGIEQENGWGWSIGWLLGGIVIGLGMWLATKKLAPRSKSAYFIGNIAVWGYSFFISQHVSDFLIDLFTIPFGELLGWNIVVNANVGFIGLAGGLFLLSQLNSNLNNRINWKTVLAATLGFGLGNLLVIILFTSFDEELVFTLAQLAIWGFFGGAALAFPSKNSRRYLFFGLLGSLGMLLGRITWIVSGEPGSLHALILGAFLGMCLGIGTKKASGAFILFLIGAFAYMTRNILSSIYYDHYSTDSIQVEYAILALTAALMGLILSAAWSLLNSNETDLPANQNAQ
jgi:hypothetical protein